MKLQLKHNVLDSAAKVPTASQLEYGELAVNYNGTDPTIFMKDSNNTVIPIAGGSLATNTREIWNGDSNGVYPKDLTKGLEALAEVQVTSQSASRLLVMARLMVMQQQTAVCLQEPSLAALEPSAALLAAQTSPHLAMSLVWVAISAETSRSLGHLFWRCVW